MDLSGIVGGRESAEELPEIEIPDRIPAKAVYVVRSDEDVHDFPRGALVHLPEWDEELAMESLVAGAAMLLVSPETQALLAEDEAFDVEAFGILTETRLEMPAMDAVYLRNGNVWQREQAASEEE